MIHLENNNDNSKIEKSVYPDDYKLFGSETEQNELKIFIDEIVLKEIDDYLSSDTSNELGGVLLGNVYKDRNDNLFIVIDSGIRAEHSTSSISRLTFTHETWDYINSVLEEKYPSKKILGWYHSHPGHTVFLSGHDLFIHENFFNLPFMVAYVFDPTINDRAFFSWKENEIKKAAGFYIMNPDDTHKQNFTNRSFTAKADNKKDNKKFQMNLLWTIVLLNLLLTIILLYNFVTFDSVYIEKDLYEKNLSGLKSDNENLRQRLEEFISQAELNYSSNENVIYYTVKEGDDLKKISFEFYGNEKNSELILKENNLTSENDIKPGEVLKIPKLTE
jgi:proteasome lid subunit RPN8/RPN11